jgi:hypothetical protein
LTVTVIVPVMGTARQQVVAMPGTDRQSDVT